MAIPLIVFMYSKPFGCGLFVHRIHHSDPVGTYHSHPWSGLSIIFGRYKEIFPGEHYLGGCAEYVAERRFFNWVRAGRHHRVVVDKPVWTLFFHLRKSNQWEIIDDKGNKVEAPWEGDKGHKSYTEAIGPQRAAPKSFAAVKAEVRQYQRDNLEERAAAGHV